MSACEQGAGASLRAHWPQPACCLLCRWAGSLRQSRAPKVTCIQMPWLPQVLHAARARPVQTRVRHVHARVRESWAGLGLVDWLIGKARCRPTDASCWRVLHIQRTLPCFERRLAPFTCPAWQHRVVLRSEATRTFWFNPASLEAEIEYALVGAVLGLAIYNGRRQY